MSATELMNSVDSYVGSKVYLKKVIPMFICNILYNRVDCHEYFESRQIKTLKYMIFKPHLKNHQFAYLYHWTKAAVEALENNYVSNDLLKENHKFLENSLHLNIFDFLIVTAK